MITIVAANGVSELTAAKKVRMRARVAKLGVQLPRKL